MPNKWLSIGAFLDEIKRALSVVSMPSGASAWDRDYTAATVTPVKPSSAPSWAVEGGKLIRLNPTEDMGDL